MKRLINSRGRLARVRKIQHNIAAARAAHAAGQVDALETNRNRLASLRAELNANAGLTDGAALARLGELAMRLDAARVGMTHSIESARAIATAEERMRVDARKDQEGAERLHDAARRAAAMALARRAGRAGRPRRLDDQEEQ